MIIIFRVLRVSCFHCSPTATSMKWKVLLAWSGGGGGVSVCGWSRSVVTVSITRRWDRIHVVRMMLMLMLMLAWLTLHGWALMRPPSRPRRSAGFGQRQKALRAGPLVAGRSLSAVGSRLLSDGRRLCTTVGSGGLRTSLNILGLWWWWGCGHAGWRLFDYGRCRQNTPQRRQLAARTSLWSDVNCVGACRGDRRLDLRRGKDISQ